MKDGKKEMKKLTSKQVRLMERVRDVKNKVLKKVTALQIFKGAKKGGEQIIKDSDKVVIFKMDNGQEFITNGYFMIKKGYDKAMDEMLVKFADKVQVIEQKMKTFYTGYKSDYAIVTGADVRIFHTLLTTEKTTMIIKNDAMDNYHAYVNSYYYRYFEKKVSKMGVSNNVNPIVMFDNNDEFVGCVLPVRMTMDGKKEFENTLTLEEFFEGEKIIKEHRETLLVEIIENNTDECLEKSVEDVERRKKEFDGFIASELKVIKNIDGYYEVGYELKGINDLYTHIAVYGTRDYGHYDYFLNKPDTKRLAERMLEKIQLAQSKDIKDATPEEILEMAEKLGMPSLEEEVSPEPTPEDVIEWQGLEKNKTYTNKSEEKEMNTINKNALNNRMVKLGEFLKENTDKQEIENKVFELFPKAMEVEVFNSDNVVYFLVGQDYVGKAPTKKEMKEKDYLFDSIDRMYGLSVHISVDEDKIKMDASIGVDYSDEYGHSHYTDCTVKEIEIELELTMEKAKRKAEYLRELHKNGKIRATYGWDKIRELSLRETTDEVLDFLIEELTYYACEEKKEKEKNNVEHIQYKIEKAHYSFAVGTESVEKILISLKRLYQYCHNDELKKQVDETVALYEKAEDSMWRESVRKQVTELVEKRQKAMVQRNIDKLEKAVTGRVSYEDARKILDEFAIYIKREWKEDTKGYRVVTEPMRSKCFGVGNEKNITGGCEKIICTRGLQYGIEWKEDTDTMVIFVEGKLEYIKDGEVVTDEKHCIFKKEINCNPDPEKDELDSIEESEVVTEKPEQTRLDDTSQPKKRKYATIEQYDYVNKEEFEKHRKEMEDAGFRLINGIYGGLMDAGELGGSETWTYTASYIKSDMY